MIVDAKEIMRRLAQTAHKNGEITDDDYDAVVDDLGIVTDSSSIRATRVDVKTGKLINHETIRVDVAGNVVSLRIDSGRVQKIWRMPIEKWEILRNPTGIEEE